MNIFGKYFDDNEKVLKSLTKVYGIGRQTALEWCMAFGIGSNSKVKDLSKETWSRIIQAVELGPNKYAIRLNRIIWFSLADSGVKDVVNKDKSASPPQPKVQRSCEFVVNPKLHQNLYENRALATIRDNIDLAKKIKSYRGLRHFEGLPCRGQRTHTNAITARKRRK